MSKKTIQKDGGGKFQVMEQTTVAELKKDGEVQPDEVVYDPETMQRVGDGQQLTPGREFGTAPANSLG